MGTDKRARQKEQHRSRLDEARREAEKRQRTSRVKRIGGTVIGVVVVIAALTFFFGDNNTTKVASKDTKATSTTATTAPNAVPATCPPTDGSATRTTTFSTAFPDTCTDATKKYTAKVATSEGDFTVELNPAIAPKTVNNFVSLARWKFFDGLTFHRIIKDFVIQGGDPQGTGAGGPGYKFADELPKPEAYKVGSVVMANSGPDTNGSQFFVVASPNGAKTLVDAVGGVAKYSLFGQVTAGLDVVTKIDNVPTGSGDKPTTPVKIISVTITES